MIVGIELEGVLGVLGLLVDDEEVCCDDSEPLEVVVEVAGVLVIVGVIPFSCFFAAVDADFSFETFVGVIVTDCFIPATSLTGAFPGIVAAIRLIKTTRPRIALERINCLCLNMPGIVSH